MPRRQHVTLLFIVAVSAFLGISFLLAFRGEPEGGLPTSYKGEVTADQGILHGEAKAPKLENATLKFVFPLLRQEPKLTIRTGQNSGTHHGKSYTR